MPCYLKYFLNFLKAITSVFEKSRQNISVLTMYMSSKKFPIQLRCIETNSEYHQPFKDQKHYWITTYVKVFHFLHPTDISSAKNIAFVSISKKFRVRRKLKQNRISKGSLEFIGTRE